MTAFPTSYLSTKKGGTSSQVNKFTSIMGTIQTESCCSIMDLCSPITIMIHSNSRCDWTPLLKQVPYLLSLTSLASLNPVNLSCLRDIRSIKLWWHTYEPFTSKSITKKMKREHSAMLCKMYSSWLKFQLQYQAIYFTRSLSWTTIWTSWWPSIIIFYKRPPLIKTCRSWKSICLIPGSSRCRSFTEQRWKKL